MREGPQVLPCLSPRGSSPSCKTQAAPSLQAPGRILGRGVHTCVPSQLQRAPRGQSRGPGCQKACAQPVPPHTPPGPGVQPENQEPVPRARGHKAVARGERPAPPPARMETPRRAWGETPDPAWGAPVSLQGPNLGGVGPTPSISACSHRGGECSPPQFPLLTHHCPMTLVKPLASAPSPRLQVGLNRGTAHSANLFSSDTF